MPRPGIQVLSIIITDLSGGLVSDAIINANITLSNGTIVNATFIETAFGNYTFSYNFTEIGDYPIKVHISKENFLSSISGEKAITVGLVKFLDFTAESEIVQGGTMHFQFSAKNIGNVSSTIIPSFQIFDSSGNLVFSKSGSASLLEPNITASLIQFNIMTWAVQSAAPGFYNASGTILFTDPDNISQYTPNRTLTFRVIALPAKPSEFTGDTGGRIITKKTTDPTYEFLFSYLPILIEAYPTDIIDTNVGIFNPRTTIRNAEISITDLPERWYHAPPGFFDTRTGESVRLPLRFTIPLNAETGNHLSHIIVANENVGKETSYILRINQISDQYPVLVYESAYINEIENTTNVNIRIRNVQDQIRSLRVVLRIDKRLAQNLDDVIFLTMPSSRNYEQSLVEFDLNTLESGEEVNITYFVRKIANDTLPFTYSSVEEIQFLGVKKTGIQVSFVTERYTYVIILILLIIILILLIFYLRKRRKIKKAVNEARHAVGKMSQKNHHTPHYPSHS